MRMGIVDNNNPYWLGFYLNRDCINHPETGRWTLLGYFRDSLVCCKYENSIVIDIAHYKITDVRFVLKKINPFLFASMSKFFIFIKSKALNGYWMNFDENINVDYE